ncbi:exosome complex component 10 homolog isoform X2 [Planococcus citri]|uniref:exosome complex component 10 homolog isoform X2 n=1 Tax=Planococcus citri TaxID=170843 RepID=UPI0031F81D42
MVVEKMEPKSRDVDCDFSALVKNHIRVLADCIKISNSLPVGSARNNFVACFPEYGNDIQPYTDQLENMMSDVLRSEGLKTSIRSCDNEEKVDLVVDGVNRILDRVKRNIDQINGIAPKNDSFVSTNGPDADTTKYVKQGFFKRRPTNMARVHVKPQLSFKVRVDNSKDPFKPNILEKPNSLKPLDLALEKGPGGALRYSHPYLYEINFFAPPRAHLRKVQPQAPWDVNEKPEIFVETSEQLKQMLRDLLKQTEIAVDLEHHDYRSYQGFTCLMQISTRKDDYIIDAITLRDELHILNEVFTDPAIVKVFHGAELDVEWLQKDLNLYVVNMFDTFFAAMELNFHRLGLAFLLEHYCNVKADKQYQLYDWRIRPLDPAAQAYARSDTHYLLYVYDRIRNDLIDKDCGDTKLVESIFNRASDICKKRYEKPNDEVGLTKMIKDCKRNLDNRQLFALRHLYLWRDEIARKEDESLRFVLPNHMLFRLVDMLPQDRNGILGCCNPIPILVRKNLDRIFDIISEARKQPVQMSSMQNFTNSLAIRSAAFLSKLQTPHDFSHLGDFRNDLSNLLAGSDIIDVTTPENEACVDVFVDDSSKTSSKQITVKFVSPYERYKRTVEFMLTEEEKARLEKQEESKPEEEQVRYIPKSERHKDKKVEPETNYCTTKPDKKVTDNVSSKRKAENSLKEVPNKKISKNIAEADESKIKTEPNDIPEVIDQNEKKEIAENKNNQTQSKSKNVNKIQVDDKQKQNFVPHDYSAGNYKKFASGAQKNVQKLLNSKIKFGANKKNRKNFHQGGGFTGKSKK